MAGCGLAWLVSMATWAHISVLTPCGVSRLRAQAAQEEEVLAEGASDLGSDESSGEYETDSDEDARQLLKPTFTQKKDRETIAERERAALEEEQAAAQRTKQLELRKGETKSLVIDRLRVRRLCQSRAVP